ncbi:MAG: S1 RNA-binding domain-containing protein [Planctomycetota bacterium]
MLQPGDEITAPVVHVAPFGAFLDFEGQRVLVRITDLSLDPAPAEESVRPGDRLRVRILAVTERQTLASALPFLEPPPA